MLDLKLIIGGYEIVDFDNADVAISFNLKDIREWDKRKTSFSKPISVKQTSNTIPIFKTLFNINNVNGYDMHKKVSATLLQDGISILNGYVFIDRIYLNTYDIIIASNDIDIFNRVGDNKLEDLQFNASTCDHYITKPYVINQMSNPSIGLTPLLYNVLDFDNTLQTVADLNQDIPVLPAYNALFLFNKILTDNSYGYDCTSDTSALLQKLYIPWNKDLTSIIPSKNYVFYNGDSSIIETITAGKLAKLHFNGTRRYYNTSRLDQNSPLFFKKQGDDFTQVYENDYKTFYTNTAGYYKLIVTLDVSSSYLGDFIGKTIQPNMVMTGVDPSTAGISSHPFSIITINSSTHKLYSAEIDAYLNNKDYFQVSFVLDPSLYYADLMQPTSTIQVFKYSWPYGGDVSINLNNALPLNYPQKDFLQDFLKYFNIYIIPDSVNKSLLHLKTYDEYLAQLIPVDWTSKVSDEDFYFEDSAKLMYSSVNFGFTQDTDIYNADYDAKYKDVLYGKLFSNPTEITQSNPTDIIFTTSPVSSYDIGNSIYIPKIFDNTLKMTWNKRLLFANSYVNVNYLLCSSTGVNYTPTNITSLSHFSGPFDNVNSVFLGFDNTKMYIDKSTISNNTIYNKFYKKELEDLTHTESKLLTVQMNLLPSDVYNIFNKKIYIASQKWGNAWYRINSILNYKNSRSLCEVKLQKIVTNVNSYVTSVTPLQLTLNPLTIVSSGTISSPGGGGGTSGSSTLAGLSDVNITSVVDKNVLTYDDATNKWINATGATTIAFHNLTDVSVASRYNENGILYNADSSTWDNHPTVNISDVFVKRAGDNMYGDLTMTNPAIIWNDYLNSTIPFYSGFAGSGYSLARQINNDYDLTVDNLIVRKLMKVYELEIDKISAVNGGIMISVANGKAINVDGNDIYFDEDGGHELIQFAINDYIRAQEWTGRGVNYYLGKVLAVTHSNTYGAAYIQVTHISGLPWTGAELVQVGNSLDAARQNIIYITAADSNNPYIDMLAGVTDGTFAGHTKVRLGNLTGITDADFGGALKGYGLYSNNIYLKGIIKIVAGSGYSNITDKPTTLAGINATEGAKLTGIAAGATVGATWGSNLYSIPATLGAPAGTGLFLSSTNMGYYTSGTWKTYIDNTGNMILGNIAGGGTGLSWNQGTGVLSIKGAISITNTIPIGSVSGTGDLATANSVDLTTQVTNRSLANLDSTANSKLSGIEAGATVTATHQAASFAGQGALATLNTVIWGTHFTVPPRFADAPAGAGLVMTATYMGYYDGGAWTSYIDNAGNAKFVNVLEFGTSTISDNLFNQNTALKGNRIWENSVPDDHGRIWINQFGYHGGSSYHRDTLIGDGKNAAVVTVDGAAAGVTIEGHLHFQGTTSYLIVPNLSTVQRQALTKARGMIVYDTNMETFLGVQYTSGALHWWNFTFAGVHD